MATIRFTDAADGNFAIASPDVSAARSSIDPRPWTWLMQAHGAEVVEVDEPGGCCGAEADASISATRGAVLAVQTADCTPVVLWSPEGVVGVVHSGWRGAEAGVTEAAVQSMRHRGARSVHAVIGPHIHVGAYEFSPADAGLLIERYGRDIIGETDDATPGLDMKLVVRRAIEAAGAILDTDVDLCTSSSRWWSHRVRRDPARQTATVVMS
ncbi:MAG: polyphenol oxidase family protein [Actinomycetia bacterium]|nr:polyphenol oxidase family protein [Actinomycetes bacterium]MCP4962630.1 polyphenol oxidase family protein [Actinomycetes bacterium]